MTNLTLQDMYIQALAQKELLAIKLARANKIAKIYESKIKYNKQDRLNQYIKLTIFNTVTCGLIIISLFLRG